MRVPLPSLILLAAAAACNSENEILTPPPPGEVNPVDLENPVVEDEILQLTPPVVDVLWVIDNSGSMQEEQTALTDSFESFVGYFVDSGLDYHIGVVSTDMTNPDQSGRLREAAGQKWIDVDTRNAEETFRVMASIGISGSPDESGRAATFAALELEKDDFNAGYLRGPEMGGGVHVVIITDEQDASTNEPVSKPEFIQYMNDLREDPTLVTFNSIVAFSGPTRGTDYLEYTAAIGGSQQDITTTDWVSVLEDLGVQAAGLNREYFLSRLPVESTIEVSVTLSTGVTTLTFTPDQYTYSAGRNSITFLEYVPAPLSTVKIKYTLLSSVVNEEILDE